MTQSTFSCASASVSPRAIRRWTQYSKPVRSRPSRDAFFWGSPAFACAYWLAAQHAAGADPAETALDDLPAPLYDDGRGDALQPPLEVLLTERARAAAEQHGIVALAGGRNTTRIAAGGLFAFAE